MCSLLVSHFFFVSPARSWVCAFEQGAFCAPLPGLAGAQEPQILRCQLTYILRSVFIELTAYRMGVHTDYSRHLHACMHLTYHQTVYEARTSIPSIHPSTTHYTTSTLTLTLSMLNLLLSSPPPAQAWRMYSQHVCVPARVLCSYSATVQRTCTVSAADNKQLHLSH